MYKYIYIHTNAAGTNVVGAFVRGTVALDTKHKVVYEATSPRLGSIAMQHYDATYVRRQCESYPVDHARKTHGKVTRCMSRQLVCGYDTVFDPVASNLYWLNCLLISTPTRSWRSAVGWLLCHRLLLVGACQAAKVEKG